MTEHDHPDRADVRTAGAGSSHPPRDASGSGMPRWVKGFAIAAAVLVLLIIIMLLTGHGPGRHLSGLGQSPASSQTLSSTPPDGLQR